MSKVSIAIAIYNAGGKINEAIGFVLKLTAEIYDRDDMRIIRSIIRRQVI